VIYQSSQHLLQIVNEVLDYSRIISGKFTFASVAFNMQHLLKEVKNIMQVQADKKHLQLIFDTDMNQTADNIGDPFRLKQILYNLLGNAIKFTDKGAVTLSVSQKDFPNRTTYIFTVKDTGIGISDDDINKIFNQFEQAKNSANHDGAGLGLNIVQALVESQKGNIQVKSIPGEGSEFIVALSYAKAKSITASIEDNSQYDAYNGKVWIIDDDKFILQLCSGIMEKHHIPYRAFTSPKEVLATPYDNAVTTILLDIRMPDISGIELCRMLKQRMTTHSARLIALTAQAFPDEKERLLQAGFDKVLMKPFMEQDIINLLHDKEGENVLPQMFSGGEVNIQPLMTMTGNDIESVKAILQSCITETTNDLEKIGVNITRGDYIAIADILHPMASRCAQIGARQLSHQLRDIEISLRTNQLINDREKKLNDACDRVIDFIAQIQLLIPTLGAASVPTEC